MNQTSRRQDHFSTGPRHGACAIKKFRALTVKYGNEDESIGDEQRAAKTLGEMGAGGYNSAKSGVPITNLSIGGSRTFQYGHRA
jgi:hypothetical protein